MKHFGGSRGKAQYVNFPSFTVAIFAESFPPVTQFAIWSMHTNPNGM